MDTGDPPYHSHAAHIDDGGNTALSFCSSPAELNHVDAAHGPAPDPPPPAPVCIAYHLQSERKYSRALVVGADNGTCLDVDASALQWTRPRHCREPS